MIDNLIDKQKKNKRMVYKFENMSKSNTKDGVPDVNMIKSYKERAPTPKYMDYKKEEHLNKKVWAADGSSTVF